MLKESKGQAVGVHKQLWYHYARNYSIIALQLYGELVDEKLIEGAKKEAQ